MESTLYLSIQDLYDAEEDRREEADGEAAPSMEACVRKHGEWCSGHCGCQEGDEEEEKKEINMG